MNQVERVVVNDLSVIIGNTQKIVLVMLLDFGKSADYEVCSSNDNRFGCIRHASIRGLTTALPGESRSAV